MEIVVGGQTIEAGFRETATRRSDHTGQALAVGDFEFVVHNPNQQDEVAASLQSTRRVITASDRGRRFAVLTNSYSSASPGGPWIHSVQVQEVEELNPSEIVIDGMRLKPDRYEENADDGGITIATIVSVDAAERPELDRRIKAHNDGSYFDVVRVGLENHARLMRFGRNLWSDNGSVTKYHLFLVEKATDEARSKNLPDFYPDLPNIRRGVVNAEGLVDELMSELVSKGVLAAGDRQAIESRAKEKNWDRTWALFKVDDIDKTWLGGD